MKKEVVVTLVLVGIIMFLSWGVVSASSDTATGCDTTGGKKGVSLFDAVSNEYVCFTCGVDNDKVCPAWYGAGCSDAQINSEPNDCSVGPVPGLCGNGVLNTGEACDDHNTVSGDGCSSTCEVEISEWCIDEGITNCGDYMDSTTCGEDECNKAGKTFWESYTAGGTSCEIEIDPECKWSGDAATGFCYTSNVPTKKIDNCEEGTEEEIIQLALNPCGYKSTKEGDCKAGGASVKISYSLIPGGDVAVCAAAKAPKTFPCPASVELPFFSIFNLIVTILIIAGIYAVILKKK
jgi:cysteine-rich repeat protein